MLKVGLAGCGGISGAHIPAWDKVPDAKLVAVCDTRPEMMEKCPDARHYTSYEEMLASEELDVLDICLPTFLHTDCATKAMERGIHVLCEKPISLHKEDVAKLYETAQKHNVKFMVAQVLRFWSEYAYIKQVFDNKTYGNLLSGSMTRLGCYPAWSCDGWMMDDKRSGLVPFDLHIHDLDFMVYAFGAPQSKSLFRAQKPDQDCITAVYNFDGFYIVSEASWYASPYPFKAQFRFQFENAVIANEGGLTVYEKSGKVFRPLENADPAVVGLPTTDAYLNEILYFVDCVRNDTPTEKVKPEQLETVIDLLNAF